MKEVELLPVVEVPYDLRNRYPIVFKALDKGDKAYVGAYVNRFYNEKGDVIEEYKQLFKLGLVKESTSYYINLGHFHVLGGIPIGYFVDVLLINFVIPLEGDKKAEIPIYPNEFRVETEKSLPETLSKVIDAERLALERVGRDVEVVGYLYSVRLNVVAADLTEALDRFYN